MTLTRVTVDPVVCFLSENEELNECKRERERKKPQLVALAETSCSNSEPSPWLLPVRCVFVVKPDFSVPSSSGRMRANWLVRSIAMVPLSHPRAGKVSRKRGSGSSGGFDGFNEGVAYIELLAVREQEMLEAWGGGGGMMSPAKREK